VVIARTSTGAREMEHNIMKQVFTNMGVHIIGLVPEGSFVEGGDFFVAKDDLCMLGIGIRSSFKGAAFLMENDLLGTERMALVIDETDLDQQRMHLDTFFNILSPTHVLLLDFEELSKIKGKSINRRVYTYSNSDRSISSDVAKALEEKNKLNDAVSSDQIRKGKRKKSLSGDYCPKTRYGKYQLTHIHDDINTFITNEGFTVVKASNKEQEDYMINFLNIGNSTLVAVNPELKNLLKREGINDITVIDVNFGAVVKMYGAVHCATQVSRITPKIFLEKFAEDVKIDDK